MNNLLKNENTCGEISMKTAKELVIKALEALGVKYESEKLNITNISTNRFKVTLKGTYFGIFDTVRNTFVD